MTCNDVLIRLRYMFDYSDTEMVSVFAAADHVVTEEQVKNWLAAPHIAIPNPIISIFFFPIRAAKKLMIGDATMPPSKW